MFPITDSSQTVMDALVNATQVRSNAVTLQLRTKVVQIVPPSTDIPSFQVTYTVPTTSTTQNNNDDGTTTTSRTNSTVTKMFDAVIVATGSAPAGYALIAQSSGTNRNSNNPGNSDSVIGVTTGMNSEPQLSRTTLPAHIHNENTVQHSFISTVPSLFTFNCKHAVSQQKQEQQPDSTLLYGLSGVTVPKVQVSFIPAITTPTTTKNNDGTSAPKKQTKKKKIPAHLTQEGPILITHHGLSGPAVLRLSAFGARDIAESNYRGTILVNWIPDITSNSECFDRLWSVTSSNPKKTIVSQCPILIPTFPTAGDESSTPSAPTTIAAIPKRLWSSFVLSLGISDTLCWGQATKVQIRALSELMMSCPIEMTSKSTNKEEFVTAGGVSLSAIHMKTMQSKTIAGLFFCGEVVNIDGITGGFNFYNCWATGYVAGTSAASYVLQQ
jgi:predicted flavoprotein YhiN